MFQLEVARPGAMSTFRVRMTDRLQAADERAASTNRRFGSPALWAPVAATALGAVAGLSVAELADWSQPGLVAAASGAGIGSVTAALGIIGTQGGPALTEKQTELRVRIAAWTAEYIRAVTDGAQDISPIVLLHEEIDRRSAVRNGLAGTSAATPHQAQIDALVTTLHQELLPDAEALHEDFIRVELGRVARALSNGAPSHGDETLFAIHRLVGALEVGRLNKPPPN